MCWLAWWWGSARATIPNQELIGQGIANIVAPLFGGFAATGAIARTAIPLCCLSAVLFLVAWNMSELPHVVRLIRGAPKVDVGILLLTFFLTVFVDLVVAVNVGVILAALFFMRRMADSVNIEQQIEMLPESGSAGTTDIPDMPAVPANTGIFAIEEIITDFQRHGAVVLLVEVRANVRYKLERGGVVAHVGPDNVVDTLDNALLRAKALRDRLSQRQ